MGRATEAFLESWKEAWAPDRHMSVSEWADAHVILPKIGSAEPGPYRTSRTPYLREIADCLSRDHPGKRIVVRKGAQVGLTQLACNWIGYTIDQEPGPIMMVQPTVRPMAERVSKQRIQPMITSTPVLQRKVRDARSRDSGNTVFIKEFAEGDGVLILVGANSESGLRSMPMEKLILDEVDAYDLDVEGMGDPIAKAEKRQSTFRRRKTLFMSTPSIKDLSRIDDEFAISDQRYYFIPCPHCGHMDYIRWENIRWEPGRPETARLLCVKCGVLIEEHEKFWFLAEENGAEWRPTAKGDGKTWGYHLPAFYTPVGLGYSWAEHAEEFLKVKDNPPKFQVWWNEVKAESWEQRTDSAPEGILGRAETYKAEVPNGVGILVAAVDVQGDRLECKVKGFGAAEESWLIAWEQIHGDPAQDEVWFDLDELLLRNFIHESGRKVKIECATVDTGGHHTEQVYRFCRARLDRRVFAIKGGKEVGKPIVGRPSANNRYRTPLFILCTDTAKGTIFARLRIKKPRSGGAPGYMHMPDWINEAYVDQLTAEKGLWKNGKRVWVPIREANHALDLEVYCLAALNILGETVIRSLPERAAQLALPYEGGEEDDGEVEGEEEEDRPASFVGTVGGDWVDSWRH